MIFGDEDDCTVELGRESAHRSAKWKDSDLESIVSFAQCMVYHLAYRERYGKDDVHDTAEEGIIVGASVSASEAGIHPTRFQRHC